MRSGKLYNSHGDRFISDVTYQLFGETKTSYRGELVPTEYAAIGSSGDYIVELENNRKIRCDLRKMVNRATIGLPPRFTYHLNGRPLTH